MLCKLLLVASIAVGKCYLQDKNNMFYGFKSSQEANINKCLRNVIENAWPLDTPLVFIQEGFDLSFPLRNAFVLLGSGSKIKETQLSEGNMKLTQYEAEMENEALSENESWQSTKNPRRNIEFPKKFGWKMEHFGNYVIYCRTLEDVRKVVSKYSQIGVWHPSLTPKGKFILFLEGTNDTDEYTYLKDNIETRTGDENNTSKDENISENHNDYILKVFQLLWSYDVINVILVTQSPFGAYISNPYWKENICGKYAFFKKFNCLEGQSPKFFPPFISFENCNFKAGAFVKMSGYPYITQRNGTFGGLQVEPLKLITHKLKINLTIELADMEKEFGGNTTISLMSIAWRKRDVNLGHGWRLLRIYDILDPSDIYFYDETFWIVAKPELIPEYKILTTIFTTLMWVFIIVLLLLTSCVVFVKIKLMEIENHEEIIRKYQHQGYQNQEEKHPDDHNQNDIIETDEIQEFENQDDKKNIISKHQSINFFDALESVYSLTLGQGAADYPSSPLLRILILLYAIYCLHLVNFFQGELISTLTTPKYERGIRNFDDLLDSNDVIPLGSQHVRSTIINQLNDSQSQAFSRKAGDLEMTVQERVSYVIMYKNVSLQTYSSFLDIEQSSKDSLRIIGQQYLYNLESIFCMRKGHPFRDSFNVIIHRILQAGLVVKCRNDLINFKFVTDEEEKEIVLSLHVFSNPLLILFSGYIFGAILFLSENVLYRLLNKQK